MKKIMFLFLLLFMFMLLPVKTATERTYTVIIDTKFTKNENLRHIENALNYIKYNNSDIILLENNNKIKKWKNRKEAFQKLIKYKAYIKKLPMQYTPK